MQSNTLLLQERRLQAAYRKRVRLDKRVLRLLFQRIGSKTAPNHEECFVKATTGQSSAWSSILRVASAASSSPISGSLGLAKKSARKHHRKAHNASKQAGYTNTVACFFYYRSTTIALRASLEVHYGSV